MPTDSRTKTREQSLTRPALYIPLAVLCCLLWSSAFPLIKLGYRYFAIEAADVPAQILFAGCRFALAGVLTILAASLLSKKPLLPRSRQTWAHIGILALVQTVLQYSLFYMALAHIEGSSGSILNAAGSFFCVLLAAAVFRSDRLGAKKLIGCALGLLGIVLLNLKTLQVSFRFGGEGLMLLSALCYALSSVLIKRFAQSDSPALLSGWQFLCGGVVMVAGALACGGRFAQVSTAGILSVLYLAFVSAAAYTLWGILLKYNPVSKIAVFGFVIPLGGVLLSALLLGEQVDVPLSAACLGLVSAGIVLVNWQR